MADIEHFSGSIVKKLEDGTEVLSSYVDADQGDVLASQVAQSDKVEAATGNKDETKAALKDASKTQPAEAKPAALKDPEDLKKAQSTTPVVHDRGDSKNDGK